MSNPTNPDYNLNTPVPPVKRKAGFWPLLKECVRTGGPGYLQFAITNVCNAHCDFCGFSVDRFDPKTRKSVTLQEAYDTIDISVKNGIGFLLFVGGEPMAHKDLPSMLKYAADSGIQPMICTNGSLWTDENIRMYARLGLASVIMSIDAASVELHEKNRGLKGVCEKIARANKLFRELGVESVASITASATTGLPSPRCRASSEAATPKSAWPARTMATGSPPSGNSRSSTSKPAARK